jgi:alpha-tubulin suppressor-like RCC1 family protein
LGYIIDGQQALPKMIDALASVKIVGISAGEFHSLVVSSDGGLYSFGCRDNGKLGHGIDDRGVSLPNKVTALSHEKVLAPYLVSVVFAFSLTHLSLSLSYAVRWYRSRQERSTA